MNLRIGKISNLLAPGYSHCRRCQTNWRFVTPHDTDWGWKGCIALCEKCWRELTPEQRLPYYRSLIEWWHERWPDLRELSFNEEWALVEEAVLNGG